MPIEREVPVRAEEIVRGIRNGRTYPQSCNPVHVQVMGDKRLNVDFIPTLENLYPD